MNRAIGLPCALGWAAWAIFFSGCATVTEIGTKIGEISGKLTPEQSKSIQRSAQAVEKTYQDITPEQEYYIGRTVAATVFQTYKPYNNEAANQYLNVIGQTMAQASDRPETFGGYRFQIVDTDEINAFAAPGGLIMVSRGMLRCCKTEDALAAVLAHEIGHVQGQDGLKSIKTGRLTSALTILTAESAKNLGGMELAELTKAFEGSVTDITSTLMNSGYSRGLEREADQSAVILMGRVGYDPNALVDMLSEMNRQLRPGGPGFAKTHPAPKDRIADVKQALGVTARPVASEVRQRRFLKALAGV